MKVGNRLMKINNRALKNSTGNLRMTDAKVATKELVRNDGSQYCYRD